MRSFRSLKSRILLSALIPLVLLLSFVVIESYLDWRSAQSLRAVGPLKEMAQSATEVLAGFRNERAWSVLAQVSKRGDGPDQTQLRNNVLHGLTARRRTTDRALAHFRAVSYGEEPLAAASPNLRRTLTAVNNALLEIPRRRAAFDNQAPDWKSVYDYYTHLNNSIQRLTVLIAQGVEYKEVVQTLTAFSLLQRGSEEASKASALGAAVIGLMTLGDPSGRPFVGFFEANAADKATLEAFLGMTTHEQRAVFDSLMTGPAMAEFADALTRLATLPGTRNLDGLSPIGWLDVSLKRLDNLNAISWRLLADATTRVQIELEMAERDLRIRLAISVAILAVATLAALGAALPLTRRIQNLQRALIGIAHGRFDRPVPHTENDDEVGETARALETLREAAADRAASQELLKGTLGSISEGVFVVRRDGLIRNTNEGAITLFHLPADDLIGRHIGDFLPGDPLEQLGGTPAPAAATLLSQDRDAFASLPDGTRIPVRLSVSAMSVRESLLYTVVVSDMSIRQRLADNLRDAASVAQAADRAKSSFLANMSHEIRTPLNGIMGISRLLAMSPLNTEQQEHIRKILNSSEVLLGVINDILDFSKIEAGELEFETIDFSLASQLGTIKDMFDLQARQKGIDLRINVAPDVPEGLRGDPLRIKQILINLVGNAIKFTERGTVNLSVDFGMGKDGRNQLTMIVSDTGIGMSMDETSKLFQPFTQMDASTTRRFGGSGLGLAISQGLTMQMGGSIKVESEIGMGTAFTLTIPILRASGDFRLKAADRGARLEGSLKNLRVLVAEDNSVNQAVARGLLQKLGAQVDIAEDGQQAVNRLMSEADKDGYDIVLMDIQMPVMDGYEATAAIRADERFDSIPIIAMTAHAQSTERDKCLAAGMQDHITKPVRFEGLAEKLKYWHPDKRPPPIIIPGRARTGQAQTTEPGV
ncbi:response regulator [Hwanghaeella grinnelliae]|uniref:histidine kinase n=1 Tax=Hwanghaeella grinnelliae TaxID=2500179 RepID=A0A3S2VPJ4_9PROT|nr:ATP-binding protein [Hwanghaeella grinnelliae]RVU38592.1 response regulator [Hwanghaeella grinnelliae]